MKHRLASLWRAPVFCLFWALCTALAPQNDEDAPEQPKIDFLYPLDATPNVTGSFGGYRLSHHHAGLDLYVSESETTPVYAAADGLIYKLRQNHTGYGRVIYMRHSDGYSTVYAHLSAFAGQLVDFAQKNEAEKGFHFEGNPKVRVKRGEIIGYIGTSGTDLIHLHFEVRKDGQPVNPQLHGLHLKDTKPPEITRLYLKPKAAASHVFQTHDAQMIDLRQQKDPIELGGDVDLAVAIEDHMEGSVRQLQPRRFEFYIDGQLRHAVTYDQVSYASKKETELDYVAELKAQKQGFFHRLTPEGPRCSLHDKQGKRSIRDLKPGRHRAEIVAWDASGNEGRAKFTLQVTPQKDQAQWKSADLKKKSALSKKSSYVYRTPHWLNSAMALPITACAEGEPILLTLKREGKTLKKGLHITRVQGELAAVFDVSPDGGVYELGSACPGQDAIWQGVITYGVKNKKEIDAGDVSFTFDKKAFAVPFATALDVQKNPGCQAPCELEPASDLYLFANAWRPAQGYTDIGIKPRNNAESLAVYFKDGDRWWYLGHHEDERHYIHGSTAHPLAFALMADRTPPQIGDARVENHPAGPRIIVETFDKGSGVRSATMTLDGQPAPAEWQNAYKRLVLLDLHHLTGRHTVEVTAKDFAGHSQTRTQEVTLP